MHKNYIITDLHIPSNLLQDNRFTLEEKFLIAIENQYPKIVREDIASLMKITTRQVSNHRRSINKKLGEEINFLKQEENFPKREININSIEHKKNVQKVIRFLNGITSQEIYDEKQKRILEIYTHTEMFTDDDFKLFDEKINEMRSTYEEI